MICEVVKLIGFQLYKDKEEILRKGNLLRGSNLYVTEDFSRKIRKAREELLKFAREIRARDPGARVILQVRDQQFLVFSFFIN